MKRPAKIGLLAVAGLLVLAALAGSASRKHSARANLERTRLALRQQGFKLEPAEFNFAVSVPESARAFALDYAGRACYLLLAEAIDFLPPVGTNAALVMWNQPTLVAESCTDLWAELRAKLDQPRLERACVAALFGPYRSRVSSRQDGGLDQVGGDACRLPDPLAARTLLALHEQDQARAWTNLLALTKLVAGWHPLPFVEDVLYWHNVNLVRAFGVTWQAVQGRTLTEPQLAINGSNRRFVAAIRLGSACLVRIVGIPISGLTPSRLHSPRDGCSPPAVRLAWAGLQSLIGANSVRWKHDILMDPFMFLRLVREGATSASPGWCRAHRRSARSSGLECRPCTGRSSRHPRTRTPACRKRSLWS